MVCAGSCKEKKAGQHGAAWKECNRLTLGLSGGPRGEEHIGKAPAMSMAWGRTPGLAQDDVQVLSHTHNLQHKTLFMLDAQAWQMVQHWEAVCFDKRSWEGMVR